MLSLKEFQQKYLAWKDIKEKYYAYKAIFNEIRYYIGGKMAFGVVWLLDPSSGRLLFVRMFSLLAAVVYLPMTLYGLIHPGYWLGLNWVWATGVPAAVIMIPHLILNIVHWELTLYTTRKAWYFIQARRLLEWSVFFLWLLASISMNFRHRMDVSRADDLPPFFVWNVAFALSSIQIALTFYTCMLVPEQKFLFEVPLPKHYVW